ncbi:sensor histidine kinase [Plantibacter flavus]|uniref:sensor histidine kinase n=1 Tax=Plantibacter flavus TaxID=150123 RepID=UPI00117E8020|nr:HAMP domain-containing sensor histidine kinase [Plantibacter flavus]
MTLTYTALFTVAGAIMLASIYLFMRYVPTYAIRAVDVEDLRSTKEYVQASPEVTPEAFVSPALVVSDQSDILNTLLAASALVLVLLAGLSAGAGWIISGRMLKPLQEITAAAQRAATGTFDHRVALAGPRDEITELSDTFDHMLERLGRAFQAQQRFAANASHELRTPLAITQTILDVAKRDSGLDGNMMHVLDQLRETNTRSIDTVEAILDLADLDRGDLETTNCDLQSFIADAFRDVDREASARGIRISIDTRPAEIEADPQLLAQLLGNLLHNAVRHNIDGGSISIRSGLTAGLAGVRAYIEVSNSGAILSKDRVGRLMEPFYRDEGRVASGASGSRGLGLTIVNSIVAAHHGTIGLTPNADGGLRVRVEFQHPPRARTA